MGTVGRLSGGGLEDDVEVGQVERGGEAIPGGLGRVVDGGEVDDEAPLYREHGVGFDVLAAGHEDVRGEGDVAGRGHDEVDVGRSVGVPFGRGEQRANRAVGRDRV